MKDKRDNERYTRWTMNAIMNDVRDERNEKHCMMIGRRVKRWKSIFAEFKDISNGKPSKSRRKLVPRVPDRRKAQWPRVTDRRHQEEGIDLNENRQMRIEEPRRNHAKEQWYPERTSPAAAGERAHAYGNARRHGTSLQAPRQEEKSGSNESAVEMNF